MPSVRVSAGTADFVEQGERLPEPVLKMTRL